jgi:hypothetical protein
MGNLLTLAFAAHNAERNHHHRRCELVLSQDLLDDWTAAIRHGRVGQDGGIHREGIHSWAESDKFSTAVGREE